MTSFDIREQVDLIREVFTYSERFKNSLFVVKFDNAIIDHPDFPQHASDLALLHKAGIKIVVVVDASKRIGEVFAQYNIEQSFVEGLPLCPPEFIDLIKMASFDVAHRVMTALSGHKITALIGNWVRSRSHNIHAGVDLGRAGLVDRINIKAIARSLDQGYIPLFPCIGHNESGDPFYLSSNNLASSLASSLGARKLFLLTAEDVMSVPQWKSPQGVEVLDDGRILRMPPEIVGAFLQQNLENPYQEILETAAAACRAGVNRVHILDGRVGGALIKEIFSTLGIGTMVYADAYEHIRPMEIADLPEILEIMKPLVKTGNLVERSRKELLQQREKYWVYAMDGVIHGCVALHFYDEQIAEIAGLAIDVRYTHLGIGAKLLAKISEKALESNCSSVFVLSTHSSDWFLAQGFHEASLHDLPKKRHQAYDQNRNSRILIKKF